MIKRNSDSSSGQNRIRKFRTGHGFTLSEVLVTVAILAILFAVGIPAIFTIRRNMRQMELDSKAETVFMAVQNRLSKMKAAGNTEVFQYYKDDEYTFDIGENGVGRIQGKPDDVTAEDDVADNSICYYTSATYGDPSAYRAEQASDAIMQSGSLDAELLGNHWVVEYNPTSAIVYAVYYSEDRADCAQGYLDDFETYDKALRYKQDRLADGANVGYYGGGSAKSSSKGKSLKPQLTVTNNEKLSAEITCNLPEDVSGTEYPVFRVAISDNADNTYVQYYAYWASDADYRVKIQKEAGSDPVDYSLMTSDGSQYTLDLVLDDLSSNATRFVNQYGSGSDHQTKLNAGTPLAVSVTALCAGDNTVRKGYANNRETNSLFGDSSTATDVSIEYGRHLQNLDSSSGVCSAVKNAVLCSDIIFTDQQDKTGLDDWYETYSKDYDSANKFFHGFTESSQASFKPITNTTLTLLDGAAYKIQDLSQLESEDAGLFGTLGNALEEGQTVQNLIMTGTNVKTTGATKSAGAIAGKVSGSAVISNCLVYLNAQDREGKTNHDVWISGRYAGGLVGTVSDSGEFKTELQIDQCGSATVIGAYTYTEDGSQGTSGDDSAVVTIKSISSASVGGLVGRTVSGSTLAINESYADSYLVGRTAGGLVGTSAGEVTLTSDYAAGFLTYNQYGAGLASGNADVKNSYTIMARNYMDSNAYTYYATVAAGKAEGHVYYVLENSSGEGSIGASLRGMKSETIAENLNGDAGADGPFTVNISASHAYNLMGQALTTYDFPALTDVAYYGDWDATFQSGALVYYEIYSDGSCGFYGANIASTLKDASSAIVIGDGYGVVYKGDGLPSSATVKVTNTKGEEIGTETLKISGSKNYYDVTAASGRYRVFPLSKTLVNTEKAQADYYLKAQITSSSDVNYFYFNPYFARTVSYAASESAAAPEITKDTVISVRTARQLYLMSQYYDVYADATASVTFRQEKNIDYAVYDWSGFSVRTDENMRSQPAISGNTFGGNTTSFRAVYNGGCNWITNVSFVTESNYVGMFGSNSGTIRNVVLRASYDAQTQSGDYYVSHKGLISTNTVAYIGVLAGRNRSAGRITNCSVDGYYIAGDQGTILAYENSTLYIGGLVGENEGLVSSCSADTADLSLSSTFANVSMGGFVGFNRGRIENSYALGHVEVVYSRGGSVALAGFAGKNDRQIRTSYCTTALTAAGEATTSYGFAPSEGSITDCEYLNNGSFQYLNKTYAFTFTGGAGTSREYKDILLADGDARKAVNSYAFVDTDGTNSEAAYPFRAVVTDANGQRVHYGDWIDKVDIGSVGFFYWEYEEGGQNNGYHLTYLSVRKDENGSITGYPCGTTLCASHADDGIITQYGYGYFWSNDNADKASIASSSNIAGLDDAGSLNADAAANLSIQMPGYSFVAYNTRTENVISGATDTTAGLYLSGSGTTGSITLESGQSTYTYTFTPFFANSMQFAGHSMVITDNGGVTTDYSAAPGSQGNMFEVRSVEQLQYINWNSYTKTAYAWTDYTDYSSGSQSAAQQKWSAFPYLGYVNGFSTQQYKKGTQAKYFFDQTHDIDADMQAWSAAETGERFTPIGSLCELSSSTNSASQISAAYFNGTYNGNSYTIRNLEIESRSQCVGLFGITISADIQNVILYSENGNSIRTSQNTYEKDGNRSWYNLGGLAGIATLGNSSTGGSAVFENCTVSGYQIIDNRNARGYGGTNIGGFAGLTNVALKGCTAVTDVTVMPQYSDQSRNIRVGGIVGNFRGTVLENCYAGGSQNTTLSNATVIHFGGLVGGWFTRSSGNLSDDGILGKLTAKPTIRNSYSYVDQSGITGSSAKTIRPIYSNADISGSIASITNCYYYKPAAVTYKAKLSVIDSAAVEVTYAQLSGTAKLTSGTYKNHYITWALNGGGGSDAAKEAWAENQGAACEWVTTLEGETRASIDGKYSFPGNATWLEGKNYPFPTVLTQKDLVFGKTVNVHYGEWPIDEPYWGNGRDSMDLFADMDTEKNSENYGYALKVFKLYKNGKNLEKPQAGDFHVEDDSILQVIAVGNAETDEIGAYYPVTVKALNTGSTTIDLKTTIVVSGKSVEIDPNFTLEVTANLYAYAYRTEEDQDVLLPELSVRRGEEETFDLRAVSALEGSVAAADAKHYEESENGSWQLSQDLSDLIALTNNDASGKTTDGWTVSRDNPGTVTLRAAFTYEYNGHTFTAATYVDITEDAVVGISDHINSPKDVHYNEAYLAQEAAAQIIEGEDVTYKEQEPALTAEDVDFFLYVRSDENERSDEYEGSEETDLDRTIETITLKEGEEGTEAACVRKKDLDTDTEICYFLKGDEENEAAGYYIFLNKETTSDDTYNYQTGRIYYLSFLDQLPEKNNVFLKVTLKDDLAEYALTLPIEEVTCRREVHLTYEDGSGSKIEKSILSGENVLLTWEEAEAEEPAFTVPVYKKAAGWRADGTIYEFGASYTFDRDITFTAAFAYRTVLFAGNGGFFDDSESDLEAAADELYKADLKKDGSGTFSLSGYSSKTDGSNAVTRSGYLLIGWNPDGEPDDGAAPQYGLNETVSISEVLDRELYACWEKAIPVIYNAGDGTFEDGSSEKSDYMADSLAKNIITDVPKLAGYTFVGWSKTEGSVRADYQPGDLLKAAGSPAEPTELYAVWQKKTGTLSLSSNDSAADEAEQEVLCNIIMSNPYSDYSVPLYPNEEGTALEGYDKSLYEATTDGWQLIGWYDSVAMDENGLPTGNKVLNAGGLIVNDVPGYTANGKFDLTQNAVLFAFYGKVGEVIYTKTDTPAAGESYLIVSENTDLTEAAVLVNDSTVGSLHIETLTPETGIIPTYYDENGYSFSGTFIRSADLANITGLTVWTFDDTEDQTKGDYYLRDGSTADQYLSAVNLSESGRSLCVSKGTAGAGTWSWDSLSKKLYTKYVSGKKTTKYEVNYAENRFGLIKLQTSGTATVSLYRQTAGYTMFSFDPPVDEAYLSALDAAQQSEETQMQGQELPVQEQIQTQEEDRTQEQTQTEAAEQAETQTQEENRETEASEQE